MSKIATRFAGAAAVFPLALLLSVATRANATVAHHPHGGYASAYGASVILRGTALTHTFTPFDKAGLMTEELADPDDITALGDEIFVGFQNGVGPQGEPSSSGNLDSTVVELKADGDPIAQWDLQGKTDGVTADPENGEVIATVNEDGNSSLYAIDPDAHPGADQITHYNYSESLPHGGGTDAISIYDGQILISASAPVTAGAAAPQPGYPAVYSVALDPAAHVAKVAPLFYDGDLATVANVGAQYGKTVALALTDPDSNEVVPAGARFGGDFMLTSQGDQEQIFVSDADGPRQSLAVLSLSGPAHNYIGVI